MKTSMKTLPTPDLGDDQILGAVCGLRPCRHGGLRLEIEQLGSKTIVHNYGHGGCGITISFGTAEIAADLVEQATPSKCPVAVLGAGVVGLTAARELLMRGYEVTIYAQNPPEKTTSHIAGALWLPMAIEFGSSAQDIAQKTRILTRSHHIFQHIDRDRFGVELLPIYEPARSDTELDVFEHLFAHGLIDKPKPIDAFPFEAFAPPGQMFSTDFIHTHRFLDALVEEIQSLGGQIITQTITACDQLQAFPQAVLVNALGLGSRSLFGDKQVYAARGVLVHLKPQDLGYGIHDGFKYMFPRSNALILGGCIHEYDWDDTPDQEMIDEILTHHRRFFGQE